GGQVGIAPHCTLEDDAIIGAQAGIPSGKTIRRGQTVWGTPARPFARFKEQYRWGPRLPELGHRLRKLERKDAGDCAAGFASGLLSRKGSGGFATVRRMDFDFYSLSGRGSENGR